MTAASDGTSAGLRERKQRRQRRAIIENAIALFRASSVDAVRVRDIAAGCEISEATFFNYFPSKDGVLDEWAKAVVDTAFERVARAPGDAPLRRQVRAALSDLAARIESDRALMREAWSRARVRAVDTGRDGAPLRGCVPESSRRGLLDLLEGARLRGELRTDVPVPELAQLLRGLLYGALARALTEGVAPGERLETALVRSTDLLLDGFRKRNERVRAAVARPIAPPS